MTTNIDLRCSHFDTGTSSDVQTNRSFLTCDLRHGHGYEQTEDGKEECSVCNRDGETLRERRRDEMSEKLKPGCCHKCGNPMSKNPHPEAGKPGHVLEVGCPTECIPCTVLNRHRWAERAQKAESELRELRKRIAELEKELERHRPKWKICPACMGRGRCDVAHGVTEECDRCQGKEVIAA